MKKTLLALGLAAILLFTACDGPTKKLVGDVTKMSAQKVISLEDQTMVLDADGNLWVTGQNVKGEFGNEAIVPNGTSIVNWKKIAENVKDFGTSARATGHNIYSESSTLIVKKDGTLWTAGSNGYGQLGNANISTNLLNFTQVAGITNAVSVAVGNTYSIYLDKNGDVYGTGDNSLGQLGLDGISSVNIFTKINIGAEKAVKVIVNSQVNTFNGWGLDAGFTGILTESKKLLLSGSNWWTNIGTPSNSKVFTDSGLSNVTAVALGPMNTYAISNGKLYGVGDTVQTPGLPSEVGNQFTEIPVDSNYTIESIASGYKSLIIKTSSNDILVLGDNGWGKLGDGTDVNKTTITPVNFSIKPSQISACGTNTFVVGTDNSLWAAGDNAYGTYGNGLKTTDGLFKFVKVTE